jgi:cytidine deaminase
MPVAEPKVDAALAAFSASIGGEVLSIASSPGFHGVIGAAEAQTLAASFGGAIEDLAVALLALAAHYAHAPVSGFAVGAVAVGRSGALYLGANLEVAGQTLGATLHAEQAAVANAWQCGESGLAALAVSAVPCGHCRQFLSELASAPDIYVPNRAPLRLDALLPDAFGPRDLGRQGGLMEPQDHGLAIDQPAGATANSALAAANASYGPYTANFAGVALRTRHGVVVSGRHAENAAHNPSLPPLAAALSQLLLHGLSFHDIVEAVLVEAPGKASQADSSRAMLGSVCGVPLTVHVARRR